MDRTTERPRRNHQHGAEQQRGNARDSGPIREVREAGMVRWRSEAGFSVGDTRDAERRGDGIER